MRRKTGFAMILAAGALLAGGPASADVKAGVDAWSRGDFPAAIRQWQGPAEAGDADAQFNMGQAYKLGRGVPQDLAKAETLFGQAAAQGHIQASDNYGLLLFQRGERGRALPYITAAADRGDPRAQYLLGVAHFNGDGVPKDWVRAYALTNLAQQTGLPQAKAAMQQMDQFIPLDQRQQGVALAAELAEQTQATRARQLAAADLESQMPGDASPPPAVAMRTPRPAPIPSPEQAVAEAERVASGSSPRSAGADYARPAASATPPAPRAPKPVAAPAPASPAPATSASGSGPWRIQLGAFGVAGNAEALWNRVRNRPEVAGRTRMLVPAGRVTKLQAGGYASQGEAQSACTRLSAAGFTCIVTRN